MDPEYTAESAMMVIDNPGQDYANKKKKALSRSGMSVFEQLVPYERLASAGIL